MKERLFKGGLSKPLQQSVSLFAYVTTVAERPPPPDGNIRRRCWMCLNESHGDGQKEEKKLIVKVKSGCCKCNHSVCWKSVISLCQNCSEWSYFTSVHMFLSCFADRLMGNFVVKWLFVIVFTYYRNEKLLYLHGTYCL